MCVCVCVCEALSVHVTHVLALDGGDWCSPSCPGFRSSVIRCFMKEHQKSTSLPLSTELPSSPQGQFTFRPLPPPPPPPHACTCARPAPHAPESLHRNTMPARSQATDGSGAQMDGGQLHNSWALNSNIPLETR